MQNFSRIPLDVWIALTAALGILLIAFDSFMLVFAGVYGAVCTYVVVKAFTTE